MRLLPFVFAAFIAFPVGAQTTLETDNTTIRLGNAESVTLETRARASSAAAAQLRGLDKLSGQSVDLQATDLKPIEFGALNITMHDCRYPSNNPSGDAYVHLTITDKGVEKPVFNGWMVASSPALSALDHPRYDVWVIRCRLDDRTPSVVAGESSPRPIMRPEGLGGN